MADKTNSYRTGTGKVLTGADVDALAEVAGDYHVDALKTHPGRPSIGSVAAEAVPCDASSST